MNIVLRSNADRRHVFTISQSEDSAYHPEDTIVPHNDLNALDTISVHEYSIPTCLPLRKLRKQLLRMLWRGWIMLAVGVIIFLLGLAVGIIYFCIRGLTSTLRYTETVPAYVVAILLIVTGILASIFYWRRYESYATGSLVMCVVTSLFCSACATLTSVQHIHRINTLHNCTYIHPECLCYGPPGVSMYQYEVTSCHVVFTSLSDYLHIKLGLYCGAATWSFVGAILCLLLINCCRPVNYQYSEDDRRLLAEHGVNTMSFNNSSSFALDELITGQSEGMVDHDTAVDTAANEAARPSNLFERLHFDGRIGGTNAVVSAGDGLDAATVVNQQRSRWDTPAMSRFISLPGEPQVCIRGNRRSDSTTRIDLLGNHATNARTLANELPNNQVTGNDPSDTNTPPCGVPEAVESGSLMDRQQLNERQSLLQDFYRMQACLIENWLAQCQNYPAVHAPRSQLRRSSDSVSTRRPSVQPSLPSQPVQRSTSQRLPCHPQSRTSNAAQNLPGEPQTRNETSSVDGPPPRQRHPPPSLPSQPTSRRPSAAVPSEPISRREVLGDHRNRVSALRVQIECRPEIRESDQAAQRFYRLLQTANSRASDLAYNCHGNLVYVPVPLYPLSEEAPPPYCSRPSSQQSGPPPSYRSDNPSNSSSGGHTSSSHGSHISVTAEIQVA